MTSSSGIASVYKLTKLLKFSEIRKEMAFTVFGCTSFDEFGDSEIFPLHHKLISNANLVETTRVLVRRVEKEMKALVGHQGDQVSISLEALAIKSLYSQSSPFCATLSMQRLTFSVELRRLIRGLLWPLFPIGRNLASLSTLRRSVPSELCPPL